MGIFVAKARGGYRSSRVLSGWWDLYSSGDIVKLADLKMYFLHKWLVEYEVPDIKIDVLKMYVQYISHRKISPKTRELFDHFSFP